MLAVTSQGDLRVTGLSVMICVYRKSKRYQGRKLKVLKQVHLKNQQGFQGDAIMLLHLSMVAIEQNNEPERHGSFPSQRGSNSSELVLGLIPDAMLGME